MSILWTYIRELYQVARFKGVLNVLLMVVLGLLEGIGILMVIPLLSLAGVTTGDHGAGGGLLARLAGIMPGIGAGISLPVVLIMYTGIIFGQSWLQRLQSNLSVYIQQTFYSSLSIKLFRRVAYAGWPFLLSKAKADITHVLTSELMRVSNGTHFFLQIIATALIAAIQTGIAFLIAPGLTCLVLAGGLAMCIGLHPFVREARNMGRTISQVTRDLLFSVTEYLNGIKEVKSYGLEAAQIENFRKNRIQIEQNFIRFNMLQSRTDMLYKLGAAVFISLYLFCAIEIFQLKPQEFLVLTVILARLWPRLSSFQSGLQHVVMMLPAFQTVIELERRCLAAREAVTEATEIIDRLHFEQGVEFQRVSFCYEANNAHYAVQDISFTLPAGTTTAFVGVSGAGKSTLVDLLIGLLTPVRGQILLDGAPLTGNLHAWRQSIGYVPQDAFLCNTTIRENLLWACPRATEAEIGEALRMAAADDFVGGLPEGIDTLIGDRGVRLSGGERQRIVLARALLRKPSVLILDEATSSLDTENEQRIQQAIEGLHGKLTIVVIAHRISTVRNADQIIVLERGRIVEQGNYRALIENKNGRFHALACLPAE